MSQKPEATYHGADIVDRLDVIAPHSYDGRLLQEAAHTIRDLRAKLEPRTITTADELDALPEGSAVLDKEGDVSQRRYGQWCGYEMAPISSSKLAKIAGPFTVLHDTTGAKP